MTTPKPKPPSKAKAVARPKAPSKARVSKPPAAVEVQPPAPVDAAPTAAEVRPARLKAQPVAHLDELKLTIELVPKTAWGQNLRDRVTRATWERIRADALRAQYHRCGICNASEGRMNGHEIWHYDDASHQMTLTGVVMLCDLCHSIKHFGRTQLKAKQGFFPILPVIDHFLRVNGCGRRVFAEHLAWARMVWRQRNEFAWALDLGTYAKLVRPGMEQGKVDRKGPVTGSLRDEGAR